MSDLLGCDRWSGLTSLHYLKCYVFISWLEEECEALQTDHFSAFWLDPLESEWLFHMDMITQNIFFPIQQKQLCHCKYLKACLQYKGLMLRMEWIKCRLALQLCILILARIFWHKEHIILWVCNFPTSFETVAKMQTIQKKKMCYCISHAPGRSFV